MKCPTGKTGMSKARARRTRDGLRRKSLAPLSIYRCPTCGRWHLTSMEQA